MASEDIAFPYSGNPGENWQRTSCYIPVRDGTKLAADLYLPSVGPPFPIIWAHDRYRRAYQADGRLHTAVDRFSWLAGMLDRGYAAAVVDVRGSGASFGTSDGPFSPRESRDAYDLTEWFAVQPWCNGQVGMFGRSYLGIAQYLAAGTSPPHLAAIFPEMALFDLYSFVYPGGVFRNDYVNWVRKVQAMDQDPETAVAGVEADLQAAHADHRRNIDPYDMFSALPFRDSIAPGKDTCIYESHNPASSLQGIRRSQVATYHLAGWFDMWPRDATLWFANLKGTNPQRLVIGPWSHDQTHEFDLAAEHQAWFNAWIGGEEASAASNSPVQYYLMGTGRRAGWRFSSDWPPPDTVETAWYFRAGPSRTVDSENDGVLAPAPPPELMAADRFMPTAEATTGTATRWTNGYAGPFGYPDMTAYDRDGLTYTSPPLPCELAIVGHPIAHFWARCPAADGDFFVYLERVDRYGICHYLTEGVLRASHRTTRPAPFACLGLPFHPSLQGDVAPVPNVPVELVIDLHPTAVVISVGDRLRVAIRGADRDNYAAIVPTGAEVFIYRDAVRPSRLRLPILLEDKGALHGWIC